MAPKLLLWSSRLIMLTGVCFIVTPMVLGAASIDVGRAHAAAASDVGYTAGKTLQLTLAAADTAPALPTLVAVTEPPVADADGIADAPTGPIGIAPAAYPTPPTTTAPVVSLPADPAAPLNPTDVGGLLTTFLQAVKAKNWPLVAGLLIFAIVFGLRAFGGRLHPWFDSRRGAVILTVATAAVGAVVTPLLAGLPFTVELVGQAVTAALAAMGVVSGWRALKKGGTSEKHAAKQGARLVAKAIKAERKAGGALSALLVVGLLLGAGSASAQTYVRPSKGAPITLLNGVSAIGTTTSARYDWSAFNAAAVTVSVAAPALQFASCTRQLRVTLTQYDAKTVVQGDLNARNAEVTVGAAGQLVVSAVMTYEVPVQAPYVVASASISAGGLGATLCAWTVTITPLPFSVSSGSVASTQVLIQLPGGSAEALVLEAGMGTIGSTLYLENTGTSLAYCNIVYDAASGYGADPTATIYQFTLAAATVAHDGSGGKLSMPTPGHMIKCFSTGATEVTGFIR